MPRHHSLGVQLTHVHRGRSGAQRREAGTLLLGDVGCGAPRFTTLDDCSRPSAAVQAASNIRLFPAYLSQLMKSIPQGGPKAATHRGAVAAAVLITQYARNIKPAESTLIARDHHIMDMDICDI